MMVNLIRAKSKEKEDLTGKTNPTMKANYTIISFLVLVFTTCRNLIQPTKVDFRQMSLKGKVSSPLVMGMYTMVTSKTEKRTDREL